MTTIYVDHNDTVESSFIEELGFLFASSLEYDPTVETGTLFVLINGDAYKYMAVSWEQYEALRDADSVGHEYREFVRAHGSSDEKLVGADLELLAEPMRVPAPEDRGAPVEVSDDQEEFDFAAILAAVEEATAETFEEEGDTYVQGDVLTVTAGSNEQMVREAALSMAVILLAGRKNVNAALAIEYAEEFAEYIADA